MRRRLSIVLFISLFCTIRVQAQQEILIPIVSREIFALDSRGSALFSGAHTTVLELDLPANTTRWFYRFYSLLKKEDFKKYAPVSPLLDELYLKSRDTADYKISLPDIPAGLRNKVSVYLLKDSNQVINFGKQITFSKLEYLSTGSSLNNSAGWIEVCDPSYLSGKQYLGLMNHATISSGFIAVEVVAVCKQRSLASGGWSEEEMKDWEIKIVNNCAQKGEIPSLYFEKTAQCFLKSIQQAVTEEVYRAMPEAEQESLEKTIYKRCVEQYANAEEKDTLNNVDVFLLTGEWVSERQESLHLDFSGKVILKKKTGQVLEGNWYVADNVLTLDFVNYTEQKYQPVLLTPDKFAWRNIQTGNYLRFSRAE